MQNETHITNNGPRLNKNVTIRYLSWPDHQTDIMSTLDDETEQSKSNNNVDDTFIFQSFALDSVEFLKLVHGCV